MTHGMLDELYRMEEESFEKILVTLLDEENIAMKTEIQKPLTLTKLELLGVWLKLESCEDAFELIQAFVHSFRVNMVSYKRQARKEIIQALTEGLKEERSLTEKLSQKEVVK